MLTKQLKAQKEYIAILSTNAWKKCRQSMKRQMTWQKYFIHKMINVNTGTDNNVQRLNSCKQDRTI